MSKGKRLLTAVLLAALLCGCSDSGDTHPDMTETETETSVSQTAAPAQSSTAVTEVTETQTALTAEEVFSALRDNGLCGEMDVTALLGDSLFGSACEKLYGISPDSLSAGGIMFVGAGTLADEISVLGGAEGLAELLRSRAEARADDFEGYAPDEQAKARRAEVFEYGGLSVLVISDDADKIVKCIKGIDTSKGGGAQ